MRIDDNLKEHLSKLELRERIVELALDSFATHGIKSITMDEIATTLGISKRTLYEVFPDKETLLLECLKKAQSEGWIVKVAVNDPAELEIRLTEAMDDDLGSPLAIAALFDWVRIINQFYDGTQKISAGDLAALRGSVHTLVFGDRRQPAPFHQRQRSCYEIQGSCVSTAVTPLCCWP